MGPGGSERQLTELAKGLNPARFAVHVGFFREGIRANELREAGIRCFRIDVKSFLRPQVISGAVRLARYLHRHAIQVVHTFDYPLTCFGVPIARACRVPVVLSSQRGHRALTPPPYLRVVRWTDHIVDGVVVNCRAMQQHLLCEEHIQLNKIHLCYNGIDVQRFSAGTKISLFGEATPGPLVIGCVAVMRPEKNLALLVKAFSAVSKRHSQLKLLLVGSGPDEESIRSLVNSLGLSDRCMFVSSQVETADWLRSIDLFVLPSKVEALSNSLMEAMVAGCAAVASNVGGNPELIEHGRTGLLFESGNVADLTAKLELLVFDPGLRRKLSEQGEACIRETFSLESAAARMGSIYDAMLNTCKPS